MTCLFALQSLDYPDCSAPRGAALGHDFEAGSVELHGVSVPRGAGRIAPELGWSLVALPADVW